MRFQTSHLFVLLAAAGTVIASSAACSHKLCTDEDPPGLACCLPLGFDAKTGTCVSGGEGGADGGDGPLTGAPVDAPPGCDPKADPKESSASACADDQYGVFVSPTGDDGNPGTKASPVKTIGAGLNKRGNKPRVYVCSGTYAEHVKVTGAVVLIGGVACGDWAYTGKKTEVAPGDAGYALEVVTAGGELTVSDFALHAQGATAKGESSVGAFVRGAGKLVLLRNAVEAGAGKEGDDGDGGTTGAPTSGDLKGNGATGTTAGLVKTCTCTSGGTSTGGAGGAPQGAGAGGAPSLGGIAPNDGLGGAGNMPCNPTGAGHNGTDAASASDAPKVTSLGALGENGWTPRVGAPGVNGTPGQGGGGGGGGDVTSACGGGACGGCGGTGGKGGGGGGASVALLALDTTVVLRASTLTAKGAGMGGVGGGKGTGATGGSGANGGPSGCSAGEGGRGGDGGTGSGGAGGISAAVVHVAPMIALRRALLALAPVVAPACSLSVADPSDVGADASPDGGDGPVADARVDAPPEGSAFAAGAKGQGGTVSSNHRHDGQSAETLALL